MKNNNRKILFVGVSVLFFLLPTHAFSLGENMGFHRVILDKMVEGGVGFMSVILLCLIIGLAIAIERVIVLNLASTNVRKLLLEVSEQLKTGGVEAAKVYCANTRGPVATLFSQGLLRASEGIEGVEKAIVNYGSVESGKLEKGMIWISLFISLAPMLGFMGTVIGMIEAFDEIMLVGDISATVVAGGIKVALLTTVAGLVVAMVLQVFYNYCVSKIEDVTSQMEDASISFVDMLLAEELLRK